MEVTEDFLSGSLNKFDLESIARWAAEDCINRDSLLNLAFSGESKAAANALWCMTHLRNFCSDWIQSKQNFLIDRLLEESDTARKRMLLQLLRNMDYRDTDLRGDFLDYCLSRINAVTEPYAIRCFSLYISAKICRFYPELLFELKERISMLSREPLSPGMKCAVRKVSADLR